MQQSLETQNTTPHTYTQSKYQPGPIQLHVRMYVCTYASVVYWYSHGMCTSKRSGVSNYTATDISLSVPVQETSHKRPCFMFSLIWRSCFLQEDNIVTHGRAGLFSHGRTQRERERERGSFMRQTGLDVTAEPLQ